MNASKIISSLFLTIALLTGLCKDVQAQKNEEWKEKIMAEKIAFFTNEIGLTTKEAQDFWPIYNAYCKEEDEAHRQVMRSYKAMREAIEAEKSEREISELLDRYLNAREYKCQLTRKSVERFQKVLPTTKVAKLYVAEEKFRRKQIHKLHHQHGKK